MLDTFNAVWTALTTTNEELIKVILIPCNFVEVTITMLLFTTLLNIDCTKKQKFIYVISLSVFGIINSYIVPSTYNVFFNMIALPVFVFLILKFSRQMPLDTSPYSEPYVQFSRIRLLVITFTFNQTS